MGAGGLPPETEPRTASGRATASTGRPTVIAGPREPSTGYRGVSSSERGEPHGSAGSGTSRERPAAASRPVHALAALLTGEGMSAFDLGFGLVVMAGVWYVGRRMRLRAERAVELEREREAEARRVVVEERTRIARELHDIAAHRVSLMTVQAGAAKTVAGADPAGALQAMGAVEQAGREAL